MAHRTPALVDNVTDATQLRVAVARLYRALRTRDTGELTASQSSALARIESAGPLRVGQLAEFEGTSAATMSRVIDSLVDRNLVHRGVDPDDGRAAVVALSDDGAALLRALRETYTTALRGALAALAEPDRRVIAAAVASLERLADQLQLQPRDRRIDTDAPEGH